MEKTCKVVMISTNKISNIQLTMSYKLHYENGSCIALKNYCNLYILSDEKIEEGDWYLAGESIEQCLYKDEANDLTDECHKIIATTDTSLGWSNIGKDENGIAIGNCHKGNGMIIHSLLPQPSQEFIQHYIEEYNKGNIISEVNVEYEEIQKAHKCTKPNCFCREIAIREQGIDDIQYYNCLGEKKEIIKLKINLDNTINIKPIAEKMYSKEEVEGLLLKLIKDCNVDDYLLYHYNGEYKELNNWIKENL